MDGPLESLSSSAIAMWQYVAQSYSTSLKVFTLLRHIFIPFLILEIFPQNMHVRIMWVASQTIIRISCIVWDDWPVH